MRKCHFQQHGWAMRWVILSEVNQTEKNKYNFAYTWNLKKKKRVEMKLFTNQNRITDIESKLIITR